MIIGTMKKINSISKVYLTLMKILQIRKVLEMS